MFDVGFLELLITTVIALVVIGPERLPSFMRKAGKWVGQAKLFLLTVKTDINKEIQAHELERIIDKQTSSDNLHDILDKTEKDLNIFKQEAKSILKESKGTARPKGDRKEIDR